MAQATNPLSLYHQINSWARNNGIDPDDAFKQFVSEALLDRLYAFEIADRHLTVEDMIIKGGMRMHWSPYRDLRRNTKDLDVHFFTGRTRAEIEQLFEDAFNLPNCDDLLRFEVRKVSDLEHIHSEHDGVRIAFTAYLDKKRTHFQVDVGFGGRRPAGTECTRIDKMFGGKSREVYLQPMEYSMAEKIHAIIEKGITNTRHKDYRDLYVIAPQMSPEVLKEAVRATFEDRGMAIPDLIFDKHLGLQDDYAIAHQDRWTGFLRNAGLAETAPENLRDVVTKIARTFYPIFKDLRQEALEQAHTYEMTP